MTSNFFFEKYKKAYEEKVKMSIDWDSPRAWNHRFNLIQEILRKEKWLVDAMCKYEFRLMNKRSAQEDKA